jgi:DNA modification methylase
MPETIPLFAEAVPSAGSVAYRTQLGVMLETRIEDALNEPPLSECVGKVNLVFTSPPFPLVTKKRYGNKTGDEYLEWLSLLAPKLAGLLTPDGSMVIEIGNAWERGRPVMSILPLQALMRFLESAKLHLCQQFIFYNPARLPGPAQWVNVERIRVKDAFTHIWWMARSERPKADNRKVLMPYGADMRKLLKSQSYNAGLRPSGHLIGEETFLRDNGGAIPSNVLRISNTSWNADYLKYCKKTAVKPHPARMPPGIADFFVRFLTDKSDLVVDPFAGSNTTGFVAETLERRWISVESVSEYVRGSRGRFPILDRNRSSLE